MTTLPPDPAQILCGKFDSVDGSSGTLLTIPAGKVWRGWLTLNATGSVGASGSAVSSRATVQTSGSGSPTPASGQVLLEVMVSVPAQAAGTTGAVANSDRTHVTLFADVANDLLVTVTKNSVTAFAATAFGELI
jgi:hypothetical protein